MYVICIWPCCLVFVVFSSLSRAAYAQCPQRGLGRKNDPWRRNPLSKAQKKALARRPLFSVGSLQCPVLLGLMHNSLVLFVKNMLKSFHPGHYSTTVSVELSEYRPQRLVRAFDFVFPLFRLLSIPFFANWGSSVSRVRTTTSDTNEGKDFARNRSFSHVKIKIRSEKRPDLWTFIQRFEQAGRNTRRRWIFAERPM